MRRALVIYAIISTPLLLGAGLFLYLAETDHSGPWVSLGWAIYFAALAALWLAFSVLYWGVFAFRAGYRKTIYGVIAMTVIGCAGWGGAMLWQQNQCDQAREFYTGLAALAFAQRQAYTAAGAEQIAANHSCGRDALGTFFIRHSGIDREITPEAEIHRLATWEMLLARGLAPQGYFSRAINAADAELIARLLPHLKARIAVRRLGKPDVETKPVFLTKQAFHAVSRHGQHSKQREKKLAMRIIEMLLEAGAIREQKDRWGKTLASRLQKLRR